jgi:hypothetical protein
VSGVVAGESVIECVGEVRPSLARRPGHQCTVSTSTYDSLLARAYIAVYHTVL